MVRVQGEVSGSQGHFHTSVVNIVAINITVRELAALWFSSGVQMCPVCTVLVWGAAVKKQLKHTGIKAVNHLNF